LMSFPEQIIPFGFNELIVRVRFIWFYKRRIASK